MTHNVAVYSKTKEYYKQLKTKYSKESSEKEMRKIDLIISFINEKKDLQSDLVLFEENLISKIRFEAPEILDSLSTIEVDNSIVETLDFIIKVYNDSMKDGKNLSSEYDKIESIMKAKNQRYSSIYGEIGKKVTAGISPNIQDVIYASEKFK